MPKNYDHAMYRINILNDDNSTMCSISLGYNPYYGVHNLVLADSSGDDAKAKEISPLMKEKNALMQCSSNISVEIKYLKSPSKKNWQIKVMSGEKQIINGEFNIGGKEVPYSGFAAFHLMGTNSNHEFNW
jgi:hypothetical protein